MYKLIYFGLLICFGCSTSNNEEKINGHWHSIKSGQCDFETIDISDSILIANKYIVGSFIQYLSFKRDNSDRDKDVSVKTIGDRLILNYADTSFSFVRANLKECLIIDRYINSMIDLSLPEFESALPFDSSLVKFTTGDLLIGKLKLGLNDLNDNLAKQYPDSIFIQVNDMLIDFKSIPEYVRELKSCMDCPRPNINLHVDKEVSGEVVGALVKLINTGDYPTTGIHFAVKIKNRDIGLLKR